MTSTTAPGRRGWLRGLKARFAGEPELLVPMFAAAYGIGCLPLFTLPWLVGSLVRDRGFTDSVAGMAATVEIAFVAATTILLGSIIHRLPRRTLAIAGCCLVGVGGVALTSAMSLSTLLPLLALSGIGCGMCGAAGNSLMSAARDSARLAANVWLWTALWTIVVWSVTPLLVAHWNIAGLGMMRAMGCIVFLPMLFRMKGVVPAQQMSTSDTASRGHTAVAVNALLMFCTFIYWLRDSVTWSLAERRGSLLGITEQELALTLTGASILGLAGPISANLLGMRFGRRKSLIGGLIAIGLVMQMIASADSPIAYRVGFLLWTGTSIFAWTYLLEAAAALDTQGRLVAICGGLMIAAAACGPILGGALLQWGGQVALPASVLLFTAATLSTAFVLVRRL